MSQHAMRQAARRSALDARAVLRKQRADMERRLEGQAIRRADPTALGERDAAVRDADRCAVVRIPPPLAADVVRLIAIDLLGSDDGLGSAAPRRLESVLAMERIRFSSHA